MRNTNGSFSGIRYIIDENVDRSVLLGSYQFTNLFKEQVLGVFFHIVIYFLLH